MKKHLINTSIVIALTLSASQACAKNVSNQVSEQAVYEKPTIIGFGSGAVAGAIIGGPVGAVIAGTIGLLIGNAEELDDERQAAVIDLQHNQRQLSTMKSQKQKLIHNLAQVESQNKKLTQQLSLASHTINNSEALEQLKLNLQFKVNSSDVESFYQEQVKQLALLVKQNPDMQINLSGYADRNGDEDKNLNLSANRVASVKALLMAQGVSENNINTAALGESAPMQSQQNYQNDFYDRRVEINLQPQQVLTAGN